MELFFLRHGVRIDHELLRDPEAAPLHPTYHPWDPLLAERAKSQLETAATEITSLTTAFDPAGDDTPARKNVYIHFSPYLRTCETADLLVTYLKPIVAEKWPHYKVRFQLLGDFALSEWIHENMKVRPPYTDSNDAYDMYTPNLKLLANKNLVLNFRPTIQLGQFNGPGLSYKEYQERSKEYFNKLIATYDKPAPMNSHDIVIVVGHGYMINNFLLFFTSHALFDELPEAGVNYARRQENEENQPWKLERDCMGVVEADPHLDTYLNLSLDLVYYKTNFVRKEDIDANGNLTPTAQLLLLELNLASDDRPRPSFKVPVVSQDNVKVPTTAICPAARNWTVQQANKYKIKAEFKLKVMHDEAFKKTFNLSDPPLHPVTPEVLPLSEPTRKNLVIDLTKLLLNEEIYHPLKLKFASTGEIPTTTLNLRLNSLQLNLAQFLRDDLYLLLPGGRMRLNLAALDLVFRLRQDLIDLELDLIPEGRVLRQPLRKLRPIRRTPLLDLGLLVDINRSGHHIKLIALTLGSRDVAVDSSSAEEKRKPTKMFYQLDESLGSSDDDDNDGNFVWFGENLKK